MFADGSHPPLTMVTARSLRQAVCSQIFISKRAGHAIDKIVRSSEVKGKKKAR